MCAKLVFFVFFLLRAKTLKTGTVQKWQSKFIYQYKSFHCFQTMLLLFKAQASLLCLQSTAWELFPPFGERARKVQTPHDFGSSNVKIPNGPAFVMSRWESHDKANKSPHSWTLTCFALVQHWQPLVTYFPLFFNITRRLRCFYVQILSQTRQVNPFCRIFRHLFLEMQTKHISGLFAVISRLYLCYNSIQETVSINIPLPTFKISII